jgi:hypothetical protein
LFPQPKIEPNRVEHLLTALRGKVLAQIDDPRNRMGLNTFLAAMRTNVRLMPVKPA